MDKTEADRKQARLPRISTERCQVRIPIGYFCLFCGDRHWVVDDDSETEQLDLFGGLLDDGTQD